VGRRLYGSMPALAATWYAAWFPAFAGMTGVVWREQ